MAEEGGADGLLGDAEVTGELGGGERVAPGEGEEGLLGIRLGGRGVAGVLLGGNGTKESAQVRELGGGHVADAGVGGRADGGVNGDGVGAEALSEGEDGVELSGGVIEAGEGEELEIEFAAEGVAEGKEAIVDTAEGEARMRADSGAERRFVPEVEGKGSQRRAPLLMRREGRPRSRMRRRASPKWAWRVGSPLPQRVRTSADSPLASQASSSAKTASRGT